MYFLYYAGMARDQINEQIGLAISHNGVHFNKVNDHGLILPRDPEIPWKAERVCNPTVLHHEGKFLMYYQGIASRPLNHASIALAYSNDGIQFRCHENPCIPWQAMEDIDPDFNPDERVGLFEPSVIIQNNKYHMWFVYSKGSGQTGNDIYFAESSDGQHWQICKNRILNGRQFGPFKIHYPQVLFQNGHYEIWFSLKSLVNATFGIFKMTSQDGQRWANLQQILPQTEEGFGLTPRKFLSVKINEKKIRLGSAIDYLYAKIFKKWFGRFNYHGFAHPHVFVGPSNIRSLVLHNYHMGAQGAWMDISRCELTQTEQPINIHRILSPATAPQSWDTFFVGDPFLLYLPDHIDTE